VETTFRLTVDFEITHYSYVLINNFCRNFDVRERSSLGSSDRKWAWVSEFNRIESGELRRASWVHGEVCTCRSMTLVF